MSLTSNPSQLPSTAPATSASLLNTPSHNPESLLDKFGILPTSHYGQSSTKLDSYAEIELDGYGDYTDYLSDSSYPEKGIVTDRFIPSRRSLKSPPDVSDTSEPSKANNENAPPSDPSSLSLAEIYKKCIMTEPTKSIKIDAPISHFRNNNTFKYTNRGNYGNLDSKHPLASTLLSSCQSQAQNHEEF